MRALIRLDVRLTQLRTRPVESWWGDEDLPVSKPHMHATAEIALFSLSKIYDPYTWLYTNDIKLLYS